MRKLIVITLSFIFSLSLYANANASPDKVVQPTTEYIVKSEKLNYSFIVIEWIPENNRFQRCMKVGAYVTCYSVRNK